MWWRWLNPSNTALNQTEGASLPPPPERMKQVQPIVNAETTAKAMKEEWGASQ